MKICRIMKDFAILLNVNTIRPLDINSICRKTSELQGRKAALIRELEEKQVALAAIKQKSC